MVLKPLLLPLRVAFLFFLLLIFDDTLPKLYFFSIFTKEAKIYRGYVVQREVGRMRSAEKALFAADLDCYVWK